ncbi:MAG: sensor domain-containing diguanylate cyclase [Acidobacteriia bacterium]|nr:sensor domain-containing diguanylate cyclase [Terriglobia bacterium]
MTPSSQTELQSETRRRTKRRGVLLAAVGYLLAIGLLWLCQRLDLSTVRTNQIISCTIYFLANTFFLLLLLQLRWDEKLTFDPHFIYTPVFTSILWLTYFLHISGNQAQGLLFTVIFLPFVFMVSLVGLRDGLVMSSLFVISYLTLLLHEAQHGTEPIDTQAEGVRVTVFFLVMVFSCLVMERTKRQRERHISTMKEVSALQEMGKTLVSTLVVDKLVDQILSIIQEKFGYLNCSLWTVEPASQELVMRAQKGFGPREATPSIRLSLTGPGISVWTATHGKIANVADVEKDSRYVTGELISEHPIASELALPLRRQGEVFGVLDVQSDRPQAFSENDERVLMAVADYASIALANARWVDEIHDRANRDGLTGLYNHRFLMEQLEIELHRAGRLGYVCSFIMIDLDHFKSVNDLHGHQNGDEILKQTSQLLTESLRAIDIVARYGGEEFSVILLNVSKPDALAVGEKLRRRIQDRDYSDYNKQGTLHTTVSLGVSTYPDDARSPVDLIRVADEALYAAKQAGRNRVFPTLAVK